MGHQIGETQMTTINRTARNVADSLRLALQTLEQAQAEMLKSNDTDWAEDASVLHHTIGALRMMLSQADVKAAAERKARA